MQLYFALVGKISRIQKDSAKKSPIPLSSTCNRFHKEDSQFEKIK